MIKTTITYNNIIKTLISIYKLDTDGFVHKEDIKTLNFDYQLPIENFLSSIFLEFIKSTDFEYVYITSGTHINQEQHLLLKSEKQDLISFITDGNSIKNDNIDYTIDDLSTIGIIIFDKDFKWLIHHNIEIGYINFAYQPSLSSNIEILLNNKWCLHSNSELIKKIQRIYRANNDAVDSLQFKNNNLIPNHIAPMFIDFIEAIDFDFVYLAYTDTIQEEQLFLKVNKEDLILFISHKIETIFSEGFAFPQDDNYTPPSNIFISDKDANWIIYNNIEKQFTTFSYQLKFKNKEALDILKKSKWLTKPY